MTRTPFVRLRKLRAGCILPNSLTDRPKEVNQFVHFHRVVKHSSALTIDENQQLSIVPLVFVSRFPAKKLQADKEVVLAAVKNYGHALVYAVEELQADKEIVLVAEQNN